MKKLVISLVFSLFALVATARAVDPEVRKELVTRVESCEAILQEFQRRPETAIPKEVLAKARALIIVNQVRAGAILGVQDGYGVMMVKRSNGTWSLPALITAGETSIGLQLGVNTVATIYVITDDATPRLIFNRRINLGVDAKAVAGPKSADVQKTNKPIIEAPVLVYSKKAGLYAGATVKAGYIARDDQSNCLLYDTTHAFPELVYSDWVKPIPEVEFLMNEVKRLAP
jgi:lipid-binding SYLF domain-containing protein